MPINEPLQAAATKVRVHNLEIHVAHACNLTCESCSHFSNHRHKGVVSLAETKEWTEPWKERLLPDFFTLLGGEPSINPELCDIVEYTAATWPDSVLRLVSNAAFLHKHPTLPDILERLDNVVLEISIHHDSRKYLATIESNLLTVKSWAEERDIAVNFKDSHSGWSARYRGYGADMQPFDDGNRRLSWEICRSKFCRQLFDGKLWKCPAVTYFAMQDEKFRLSDAWESYRHYRPLEPNCSTDQLKAFLNSEEEVYCGLCPAHARVFKKPIPLKVKENDARTEDSIGLDPFVEKIHLGIQSLKAKRIYQKANQEIPE